MTKATNSAIFFVCKILTAAVTMRNPFFYWIAVVLVMTAATQLSAGTTIGKTAIESHVEVSVSEGPLTAAQGSPHMDDSFYDPGVHGITRSYGHGGK